MRRLVPAMRERHPDLAIETFVDDGLVVIVSEGFDAGVRIGAMIAQDMIAVRLTPPYRALIVGAPAHLSEHGTPRSIEQRQERACIGYLIGQRRGLYRWEVQADERDFAVETPAAIVVNDTLLALDLTRQGLGLAYTFAPLAAEDIKAKGLKIVLPESAIEEDGLFLSCPKRNASSPKLRAFIEIARERSRA